MITSITRLGLLTSVAVPMLCLRTTTALSATTNWINNSGGTFSTAANWDNGVPGTADTAVFARGNAFGYTVTFGNLFLHTITNDRLLVGGNSVNFAPFLGFSQYTIGNATTAESGRGIIIGQAQPEHAVLSTSLPSLTAVAATLGDVGGSSGTLNVTAGTFHVTGASVPDIEFIIGRGGDGTLNVSGGADVSVTQDAALGENARSTGTATITGVGSTWTSGTLVVGMAGTGTFSVAGGGQATNSIGKIGDQAGSTGTVNVGGAGSTWTNNGSLYVGNFGAGTLSVTAGGVVYAMTSAHVGEESGATGTVGIDGPGSAWNFPSANSVLNVGVVGQGTVNVTNGGLLNNGALSYLGSGVGAVGTVNVGGANSRWINSGNLTVGVNGAGTVNVTAGGQFTVNGVGYLGLFSGSTGTVSVAGPGTSKWFCSWALYVGDNGAGTLNITAGGQVNDGSFRYIGFNPGSNGTATVDGAGSTWTNPDPNTGDLYVGFYGAGTMHLTAGGAVTGPFSTVGHVSGSTGLVTVDGAGSTWTSDALTIGSAGTGTLHITAGGQVVSSTVGAIGQNSGSVGTVTIAGIGTNNKASKWTNHLLYVGYDGQGTLGVTAGGQVSDQGSYLGYDSGSNGAATVNGAGSAWNTAGSLIGYSGTGTLAVTGGGLLSTGSVSIGSNAGASGTATVGGAGSTLTTGDLFVGVSGAGTLHLTAGGQVSSSVNSTIALNASSIGTVTVDGIGSNAKASKWASSSNSFLVGASGHGTLAITGGGQVSIDHAAYLGSSTGSAGAVTVDGAGSSWTNNNANSMTDDLYVGSAGGGTLGVTAGGAVYWNATAFMAYASGSTGMATVDGAGSSLTATDFLVGHAGNATLNVSHGGQVIANGANLAFSAVVANEPGSVGTVSISGAGSKWTNPNAFAVAFAGTGTLTVSDAGQLSDVSGIVGDDANGHGTATVTGAGSKWTNSGDFFVGVDGTGTLNIIAGGLVSNVTGTLGRMSGSSGTATVTGAGSMWINTGELLVGKDGAGTLTISNGGTVVAGGPLIVGSLGQVKGDGNINSNVQNGGLVSPGNSPGMLTITGNYTQATAGKLLIELAGTTAGTQYDQLIVSGAVTLDGTLQVSLINSFTPTSGNSFDILDWGTLSGKFSTLQLPSLTAPLGWDISQLYTTGTLSVTATLRGDWNRDGLVTAADIPAMLIALTDLNAYKSTNQLTDAKLAAIGDFDNSGAVTNRDIQGMLDFVASQGGGGSVASVPEPATLMLLFLAATAGLGRWRGRPA